MTFQIRTSTDGDIFIVHLAGPGGAGHADAMTDAARELMRASGLLKVLIDVREVVGRMDPADTFFHVQNYPRDVPRFTVAVLDLPEHAQYDSFHETAAFNRGFNLRFFHSEAAAREWLGAADVADLPAPG